jgi:hypothetical protein
MKSYGTASRSSLHTLLDLRRAGEQNAERALAAAAAARREAEANEARLVGEMEGARAAVAMARREGDNVGAGADERAGDAQARRRFWARLEARVAAAVEVLGRYRQEDLARAIDADAAARAAHVRARQRREVVEKAIARGLAVARREAERREEAIQDDRYSGARARTNTPTTGK